MFYVLAANVVSGLPVLWPWITKTNEESKWLGFCWHKSPSKLFCLLVSSSSRGSRSGRFGSASSRGCSNSSFFLFLTLSDDFRLSGLGTFSGFRFLFFHLGRHNRDHNMVARGGELDPLGGNQVLHFNTVMK